MINPVYLLFVKRLRTSGRGSVSNPRCSAVCTCFTCGPMVGEGQENYKGGVGKFLIGLKQGVIRVRNISAIFENMQNVLRSRCGGKEQYNKQSGLILIFSFVTMDKEWDSEEEGQQEKNFNESGLMATMMNYQLTPDKTHKHQAFIPL